MAFIPAPNGAMVKVYGDMFGETVITTFPFRFNDEPVIENLEFLAGKIDDWMNDSWLPIVGAQYSYVRTTVIGLSFEEDLFTEITLSAGNGADMGDPLPNNVTLSVKRSSGLTGRSARGRVYVPGITSTMLSAPNVIDSTFSDAFAAALNLLVDPTFATDWQHVIWSYQHNGAPRSEAFPYGIDLYVAVNLVLDSQRRRLPGRGI